MILTPPMYVWLVSACVICATVLAAFFYFKKDRHAKLVYQWNGRIIVGQEKEELPKEIAAAMRAAGSPYVSLTEIAIWNAGQQTIRGSGIDTAEPLRITWAQGTKILDVLSRSKTNDTISFVVTPHPDYPNVALCSFDFLGPGEGVRLRFFETGVNYGIQVNGTVQGVADGIVNWGRGPLGESSSVQPSSTTRYSTYISIVFAALAICFVPVALVIKKTHHGQDPDFQLLTLGDWMRMLNLVFWSWLVARSGISQHRARYGRYPRGLADN